jgi:hypothetical protein
MEKYKGVLEEPKDLPCLGGGEEQETAINIILNIMMQGCQQQYGQQQQKHLQQRECQQQHKQGHDHGCQLQQSQ